jgi:hypothetical protein
VLRETLSLKLAIKSAKSQKNQETPVNPKKDIGVSKNKKLLLA